MKYPLNEIVIEKGEEGQSFLDKNDEPVTLKNGEYKMESLSRSTTYYHWDGAKLTKVY